MRFLSILLVLAAFCTAPQDSAPTNKAADATAPIEVGAGQINRFLPSLKGKNVALCVNHTAMLVETHLLDTLVSLGVSVKKVFAPEHGFRGAADAGEAVKDGKDLRTGVPISSLYGKKKRPTQADLAGIDVVVFDIQDVGARFYTYISTLYYLMDACAEYGIELIVLDRPNPNGHYVDGPVLEEQYKSFVGMLPIPIVHGCTVGELARMIVGEAWLIQSEKLQLTVVRCKHYNHRMAYDLPIAPSPNLPNQRSIYLYPSLCLFEGTVISVGRGTKRQFQVYGHPDLPAQNTQFRPRPNTGAKYPKHDGKLCRGKDFSFKTAEEYRAQAQFDLRYLVDAYAAFPDKEAFFLDNNFFEKLAGTAALRQQIIEGKSIEAIRASWVPGLSAYKTMRQQYLLYE